MNRYVVSTVCGVAVAALCLATPAHAGFMAEKIDQGVYLVSYERGRWTSGSVLDTARKAQRKLFRKSQEFCRQEGYAFMRLPTLAEIGEDQELRTAWQVFAGDEAADSFQTSGGSWGDSYSKTHKSRRVLLLSTDGLAGFEPCLEQ